MKIYGKNSVIERLRAHPSSIVKITIVDGLDCTDFIKGKARGKNIPIINIPENKMSKIGRNINTQGIIADVEDFVYANYTEILEQAYEKKKTLVFLDGLNDPQNLGALIRSLACLGRFIIVLPTRDSVSVTESVLRVASGAENYISVAQVSNINNAIKKARDIGYSIVGAVVEEGESLFETKFDFPVGLVIGSEQKGIRDFLQKQLDTKITIPMAAQTMSFNVAQAATIICYEITRQKKNKE